MEKFFSRSLPAMIIAGLLLLIMLPQTSGPLMRFVAQMVYENR